MAFNFLFDFRNVRMVFAMSYFHDGDGLGERGTGVESLKPAPSPSPRLTLIQARLLCLTVQDTKWLSEPLAFKKKKEKDKIVSYLVIQSLLLRKTFFSS